MTTTTFKVDGMTCGNCVSHVTEEVSKLQGVKAVDVTLETGAVTVTSEGPLDEEAVRAAVDEAGYQVVA